MCVQSRISVSVIHDDIVTETPVICSYDYSAGLSCQNGRSAWSCQVYATMQFLFTGDRIRIWTTFYSRKALATSWKYLYKS